MEEVPLQTAEEQVTDSDALETCASGSFCARCGSHCRMLRPPVQRPHGSALRSSFDSAKSSRPAERPRLAREWS